MMFAFAAIFALGFFAASNESAIPTSSPASTPCVNGQTCPANWQCCNDGCCAITTASPPLPPSPPPLPPHRDDNEATIEYTYPWPAIFILGILAAILFCCLRCLFMKPSTQFVCSFKCLERRRDNRSELDSAGSVHSPPRYSRCGSFHQAPPPYSEVTSKPDLYPLVITCGEGEDKCGGNLLMVHYFRNYVIQAPGSISAASTAESLNSSFICNAANEANSIIPPPYSCASNYEDCVGIEYGRSLLRSLSSLTEPREQRAPPPPRSRTAPDPAAVPRREPPSTFRENLITSPVQPLDPSFDLELELIDCELYCDGACKPQLGPSPPIHRSPSNIDESLYDPTAYGFRHLFSYPSPEIAGACESPPQPTSPTQISRESTFRRPSDERRHRRLDSAKKSPKVRKSSLYMPLAVAYPVRAPRISPGMRASSRSAPATPCGALVPNLLNISQRVSSSRHGSRSSRFDEERDPLLLDIEYSRDDHKF